jgi:ABC-type amino acid transport system permease subunit
MTWSDIREVLGTIADIAAVGGLLFGIVSVLLRLAGYSPLDLFRRRGDLTKRPVSTATRLAYASLLVVATSLLTWLIAGDGVWSVVRQNYPLLLAGIGKTLAVSLLAIFFGTLLGSFAAYILTKESHSPWLTAAKVLIESSVYLLLALPAILIIFLTYYGWSIRWNALWFIATVALAVNLSPFVAKIVAGSLNSISKEQIAAARAFGYSEWQIFKFFKVKYVILTSAQSLLVEYYTTIKLSSLTAYIGFGEVLHASQDIIKETQDPVTAYAVLALCYAAIVLPVALVADHFNRNVSVQTYG